MILGAPLLAALVFAAAPPPLPSATLLPPGDTSGREYRARLLEQHDLVSARLEQQKSERAWGYRVGAAAAFLVASPFLIEAVAGVVVAARDRAGYGGLGLLLSAVCLGLAAGPVTVGILMLHLGADQTRAREQERDALLEARERLQQALDAAPPLPRGTPGLGVSGRF